MLQHNIVTMYITSVQIVVFPLLCSPADSHAISFLTLTIIANISLLWTKVCGEATEKYNWTGEPHKYNQKNIKRRKSIQSTISEKIY